MTTSTAGAWTVHTDVFDGPMDLLLYLVKRDGIDLRVFPVIQVADSYLAYLEKMRDMHLDLASSYLVMAATLVHLKSLALLPRAPTVVAEEDEGLDPTAQLALRLLEYQRFKEASEGLERRPRVGRDVFVREPVEMDREDQPVVAGVDAFGLLEVYHALLTRPMPKPHAFLAGGSGPDFEWCCRRVLEAVGARGESTLREVFEFMNTTAERIVAFIAVLEMARLKWVDIAQAGHLEPVHIVANIDADADLTRLTGRVAEAAS
jgi:segregation and condensation protein A